MRLVCKPYRTTSPEVEASSDQDNKKEDCSKTNILEGIIARYGMASIASSGIHTQSSLAHTSHLTVRYQLDESCRISAFLWWDIRNPTHPSKWSHMGSKKPLLLLVVIHNTIVCVWGPCANMYVMFLSFLTVFSKRLIGWWIDTRTHTGQHRGWLYAFNNVCMYVGQPVWTLIDRWIFSHTGY